MAFRPTEDYKVERPRCWETYVNPDLVANHHNLYVKSIDLLSCKLFDIELRIPTQAFQQLKTIRLWLELDSRTSNCAVYHPSEVWFRLPENHDLNPAKAKAVEIAKAANFIEWSREQPMAILHELSHAYHDQFLTDTQRRQIADRFDAVKHEEKYKNVMAYDGSRRTAYALENDREFFAEVSETFFGTNDFYPFIRSELREYDQITYKLLRDLWRDTLPY